MAARRVAPGRTSVVAASGMWTAAAFALGAWLLIGAAVGRGAALSGFAGLGPAVISAVIVWAHRGAGEGVPERGWATQRALWPWLVAIAVAAGYATVGTMRGTLAMLVVLLVVPALPRGLALQPGWWAAVVGGLCGALAWVALPARPAPASAAAIVVQAAVGAALAATALLGAVQWGAQDRRGPSPSTPWGLVASALAAGACAAGTGDLRDGVIAGAIVGFYTVWAASGPGEGALAGALAGAVCMPALSAGALAPGAAAVAGAVAGLCRDRPRWLVPLCYTAATAAVAIVAVPPAWGWCLGAGVGACAALAAGRRPGALPNAPSADGAQGSPMGRPPLADRLQAAARTCLELSRGLAAGPATGAFAVDGAERGLRLAEEVCPGCPALAACWERKLPRARQMVTDLWREAQSGTAIWQHVGGPDTIFCLRPREMAETANRHAALGRQRQEFLDLMEASRQSAVTPLVGIGRVLSDLAEEVAAAREREVLSGPGAPPPAEATPVQERWAAEPAAGRLGFAALAVTLPRPGRAVSGDSVRCRSLPGDRLALAVSDGMGSGGPAAVTSAAAIEHLLAAMAAGVVAEVALRQTNDHLIEDSRTERFATIALAIIHLRNASLEWFSMGAAPGFLLHARGVREWGGGGLPAGILGAPEVRSGRARLRPGDVLVLVSDGVLERGAGGAPGGARASRPRWAAEWLRAHRGAGPARTTDLGIGLVAAASGRSPDREHDDLTVLLCELRAEQDATKPEGSPTGRAAEIGPQAGRLAVQVTPWTIQPLDRGGRAYGGGAAGTHGPGGPGV